jgi:hypothetical protein
MILVLASRWDETAARFAEAGRSRGFELLTPEDVCRSGWTYRSGDPAVLRGNLAGRSIRRSDIEGVVTTIMAAGPEEFPGIVKHDREYVAAEATSFMLAWLSALGCPMLNRPSPGCLSGPAWPAEKWAIFATGLGIPVWRLRRGPGITRESFFIAEDELISISVVGSRTIGAHDEAAENFALRLARGAGTDLLVATFRAMQSGPVLVNVSPFANLEDFEVADAMLGYFDERKPP